MREVVKESAPDAVERISYQMPAFALRGNLIRKIVKFRVTENSKKAALKSKKK
jgi:uncharacterized protein YdhG (YjbR/CyaY superfamily)